MLSRKDAIDIAKGAVTELFGPDGIGPVALEAVEGGFDSADWRITVSFHQTTDSEKEFKPSSGGFRIDFARHYKVVRLTPDGEVISITDRARERAA